MATIASDFSHSSLPSPFSDVQPTSTYGDPPDYSPYSNNKSITSAQA